MHYNAPRLIHNRGLPPKWANPNAMSAVGPDTTDASAAFLKTLGERVRLVRARRGISRKMVADAAGVSLRYLSDLENGSANASVLLLREVAQALDTPLEEIVGAADSRPIEYVMLVEALRVLPEARLRAARFALNQFLHPDAAGVARKRRIALIGLRGAGKTTLGKRLATVLKVPFIELNQEIERAAGLAVGEIHSLYGQSGYRRYERECLEKICASPSALVLSTPGSIVSDANTYNTLLTHFYTVWLRALPEDHMARVIAQGDLRPLAGHTEAMTDLRRILEGRTPFYAQADTSIDTSAQSETASVQALLECVNADAPGKVIRGRVRAK